MQYDQRHTVPDTTPLTWNFPLLRKMQSVGNPSLITRQRDTFLSLCSQLPKPSQPSLNFRTLAKSSENSFSKLLFSLKNFLLKVP